MTDNLCRVHYCCWYFGEVFKHAKSVIGIINGFVFEWMKVSTFEQYLSASLIGTSIWDKLSDSWP